MQKSFEATLSLYGEMAGLVIAKAWVSRMRFLHQLSGDEGPGFVFDRASLDAFEEDPDVQRLWETGGTAIRKRIAAVWRMQPRR